MVSAFIVQSVLKALGMGAGTVDGYPCAYSLFGLASVCAYLYGTCILVFVGKDGGRY